jgi:hypothetical protein
MAVVTIVANTGASNATTGSAYGNNLWTLLSGIPASFIPIGQGTNWMVWAFKVTGIPAGEVMNGIRVQGTNDFTVGSGGAGMTRQAVIYLRPSRSFNYASASGTASQTLVGTGTGASMNAVLSLAGATSDDLLAGNIFVGVAAGTNSGDSGYGSGTLRYNAISFTFYTGPDLPTPGAGAPSCTLTNPVANYNPGIFLGGVFGQMRYTLDKPLPQVSLTMFFTLSSSFLSFGGPGNGLTTYNVRKGTTYDPANPYSELIALVYPTASCPPGTYSMTAKVSTSGGTDTSVAQLVVTRRRQIMFMEV